MKLFYYSVFWIVILHCRIFSQIFPFNHYSDEEGLPSPTVYMCLQDSTGYMWFATQNGAAKFDGHTFHNFTTGNGLNSNNITSLVLSNEGKIYTGSYENGVNFIQNDRVNEYYNDRNLNPLIRELFLINGTFYCTSPSEFKFIENKKLFVNRGPLEQDPVPDEFTCNSVSKSNNGTLIFSTTKGIYEYYNKHFTKITAVNEPVFCTFTDRNNYLYAGLNGCIKMFKDNKLKDEFTLKTENDSKVWKIFIDSRNNIWFSLMSKGLYLIPANRSKIFDFGAKLGLEKSQINYLYEDKSQNIWVCTFGKGVYCFSSLYINNYNDVDGLSNNSVQALEFVGNNRLAIGTFDGLNIFDGWSFNNIKINDPGAIHKYIYKIYYDGVQHVYASYSSSGTKILNNEKGGSEFRIFSGPAFIVTDTALLTGHWGDRLFWFSIKSSEINYDSSIWVFDSTLNKNKIFDIHLDNSGKLWIATAKGLCIYNKGTRSYFHDKPVLNSSINKIYIDSDEKIWIGGDNGIAVFDSKSISWKFLMNGFNSATCFAEDKQGNIWIGTIQGLFNSVNVEIADNVFSAPGDYVFLTKYSGLPSGEVLSLCPDTANNIMWIGTSGGLTRFDIDHYNSLPGTILALQINKLSVEDSVYKYNDRIELENGRHNIKIDVSCMYYKNPKEIIYQTKFYNDEQWHETPNNIINLQGVGSGDYIFQVRARTSNYEYSEIKEIKFSIAPPFYDTWLFKISGGVIVCLLAVYIANRKIKISRGRDKEKQEIKNKIISLEHQALSAMMNPHFIFNCLNSVSYLVNSGKHEEANEYIAEMSGLIRINLDLASKSYVSVKQEICRLETYLKIEKMRTNNLFDHIITIEENINTASTFIPNMIIQPFVENSIWHGLKNLKSGGKIEINMSIINLPTNQDISRHFVITIKDNGTGLSNVSNKTERKSHGIRLIEDRIKLLSKDKGLPPPIELKDLSEENSETTGTIVILSLPPRLYRQSLTNSE